MTQPTFTQVRQALATQLATISGLRTSASRNAVVNPPAAVVMPGAGAFARYRTTFDGSCDLVLRVVLLVSEGDSSSGQDLMDPYIAATGSQSIYSAVQADPTLGGVVDSAMVMEATSYSLVNWAGIDYLGCFFTVQVYI